MKKTTGETHVSIESDDAVKTSWSTFHRIACTVQLPDGTVFRQEREFLDRGNAVALLPYCKENGNVLLTRQFRLPAFMNDPADAMLLEVCGGMRHQADSEAIARQEAEEEIGLHLENLTHVFSGYSSPGSITEKIDYYLAYYFADQQRSQHGGIHDEGEHIQVVEISLDQAFEMIASGAICDLRSIALISYLRCALTHR